MLVTTLQQNLQSSSVNGSAFPAGVQTTLAAGTVTAVWLWDTSQGIAGRKHVSARAYPAGSEVGVDAGKVRARAGSAARPSGQYILASAGVVQKKAHAAARVSDAIGRALQQQISVRSGVASAIAQATTHAEGWHFAVEAGEANSTGSAQAGGKRVVGLVTRAGRPTVKAVINPTDEELILMILAARRQRMNRIGA